jgi:hypothetical protein
MIFNISRIVEVAVFQQALTRFANDWLKKAGLKARPAA